MNKQGQLILSWTMVGLALLSLAAGCRPARQPEGAVTLSWTAPSEYEDETPLEDLAGYRIYWGQSPGGPYENSVAIDDELQTSYVIEGLTDGEWYFVVTAVNEDLVESRLSNEVRVEIVDGARVNDGARLAERLESNAN